MFDVKNEELREKLFDLAVFLDSHGITLDSETYRNALKVFVEYNNLSFDVVRDIVVRNNLLNLKEFIILQYLFEIKYLDRDRELISITTTLEELLKLLR